MLNDTRLKPKLLDFAGSNDHFLQSQKKLRKILFPENRIVVYDQREEVERFKQLIGELILGRQLDANQQIKVPDLEDLRRPAVILSSEPLGIANFNRQKTLMINDFARGLVELNDSLSLSSSGRSIELTRQLTPTILAIGVTCCATVTASIFETTEALGKLEYLIANN